MNDNDFYSDASNRFRENCAYCDWYADEEFRVLIDGVEHVVPVCTKHAEETRLAAQPGSDSNE